MNKRVLFLCVLLAAHTTATIVPVIQHGFLPTLLAPFQSSAVFQVFSDLCVALFLVSSWIARDCRDRGKRFWPWFALTLALGSFAPLTYLLLRERSRMATPQ
jgi:hypothetical protein